MNGFSTRMPHSPKTTDGTAAKRSTTYDTGRRNRGGAISLTYSAMPTLIGTAKKRPITDDITVPYTNASAPNLFRAGFQSLRVRKLIPSCRKAGMAWRVVDTAMSASTASTNSPQPRTRTRKKRSASGKRPRRSRERSRGVEAVAVTPLSPSPFAHHHDHYAAGTASWSTWALALSSNADDSLA